METLPPKKGGQHERFLRRTIEELKGWIEKPETRPKRPIGDLSEADNPYDRGIASISKMFSGGTAEDETQRLQRMLGEYETALNGHLKIVKPPDNTRHSL